VLLRRALERGAGEGLEVPDEVITFLAVRLGGDARTALNALELAIATAQRAQEPRVTLGDAEDSLQRKAVLYDKAGDQHYDYISAWIKSTRGSDPTPPCTTCGDDRGRRGPALHRPPDDRARLEDIGNADPQALVIAVAAAQAVEHVGLPRGGVRARPGGDLPVAAPKSDAVKRAMGEVHGHIRERGAKPPPAALQLGRLPGGAQARARQGLRLPARAPGPRQRPGAPARGRRGAALLLPRRGGAGGRRAAGEDPQGPRPRVTSLTQVPSRGLPMA
jgi:putative ATPase